MIYTSKEILPSMSRIPQMRADQLPEHHHMLLVRQPSGQQSVHARVQLQPRQRQLRRCDRVPRKREGRCPLGSFGRADDRGVNGDHRLGVGVVSELFIVRVSATIVRGRIRSDH